MKHTPPQHSTYCNPVAAGLQLRARSDPDSYVLVGREDFIVRALHAGSGRETWNATFGRIMQLAPGGPLRGAMGSWGGPGLGGGAGAGGLGPGGGGGGLGPAMGAGSGVGPARGRGGAGAGAGAVGGVGGSALAAGAMPRLSVLPDNRLVAHDLASGLRRWALSFDVPPVAAFTGGVYDAAGVCLNHLDPRVRAQLAPVVPGPGGPTAVDDAAASAARKAVIATAMPAAGDAAGARAAAAGGGRKGGSSGGGGGGRGGRRSSRPSTTLEPGSSQVVVGLLHGRWLYALPADHLELPAEVRAHAHGGQPGLGPGAEVGMGGVVGAGGGPMGPRDGPDPPLALPGAASPFEGGEDDEAAGRDMCGTPHGPQCAAAGAAGEKGDEGAGSTAVAPMPRHASHSPEQEGVLSMMARSGQGPASHLASGLVCPLGLHSLADSTPATTSASSSSGGAGGANATGDGSGVVSRTPPHLAWLPKPRSAGPADGRWGDDDGEDEGRRAWGARSVVVLVMTALAGLAAVAWAAWAHGARVGALAQAGQAAASALEMGGALEARGMALAGAAAHAAVLAASSASAATNGGAGANGGVNGAGAGNALSGGAAGGQQQQQGKAGPGAAGSPGPKGKKKGGQQRANGGAAGGNGNSNHGSGKSAEEAAASQAAQQLQLATAASEPAGSQPESHSSSNMSARSAPAALAAEGEGPAGAAAEQAGQHQQHQHQVGRLQPDGALAIGRLRVGPGILGYGSAGEGGGWAGHHVWELVLRGVRSGHNICLCVGYLLQI